MQHVKKLLETLSERFDDLAKGNAVVAKKVSVGDRHVIPLCELSLGFGGGGGTGEGSDEDESLGSGKGSAEGGGGGAKATPVAVIIVDGGKVRIQSLGL